MRISDWSSDVCSSDLSITTSEAMTGAAAETATPTRTIFKAERAAGNRFSGKWRNKPVRPSFFALKYMQTPTFSRSEEHTSELQSLMRISYAVFCLKKKKTQQPNINKHLETTTNT